LIPGRKRARRREATAGGSKGPTRPWAVASLAALALLASVNDCGFPKYDFHADGASGAAGAANGGAPGGGPSAGSPADAGTPDARGGGGGTELQAGGDAGGSAGEAGAAGAAGAGCDYPQPLIYPAHCFDHVLGDGETGIDCGGDACSACAGTQTCATNGDCLSGTCSSNKACAATVTAEYNNAMVPQSFTRSPKFDLTVTYLAPANTTLDLIRVRYYFNHNGVSEPVLGLNSQATLIFSPDSRMSVPTEKIHSQIYRTALGPAAPNNGRQTDSYIEVSFSVGSTLLTGTKLEIIQDFSAGGTDVLFDQNSHYSFNNGTNPNDTVTVYWNGKRVWGIEPPWVEFPACAYAGGVNVNGDALTLAGEALGASSEAGVTFTDGGAYANAAAKAFPSTDADTTKLLSTARNLTGPATLTWAVPNGKYNAFAWLTSAASSDTGVLTLQGSAADKFVGMQPASGAAWSLLGPYPVTVDTEALTLAVASGTVHVAGLKLYRAE
jgi:hypothetical protein